MRHGGRSPLTEPSDFEDSSSKPGQIAVRKSFNILLEEIWCAVSKASLEADTKKAKRKVRAMANGKGAKRKEGGGEDEGAEGGDELEGELKVDV